MRQRIALPTIALAVIIFTISPATMSCADRVEDFRLKDYHGREYSLGDFADRDIVVLAFLGTECPLAKLYASRLQSMADEFADQSVAIVGLNPNVQDSLSEIAAYARRHNVSFPILKDLGNKVADRLHVKRTPEVILLDRNREIRYRGRIDDQFVIGVVRDEATRHDLREAIVELRKGETVRVPQTDPIGCLIGRVTHANENSDVTYSNQIARIFNRRCVSCHRDGEIGPFAMTNYEDVEGWGDMINEVVQERRMPPWHASPKYGTFQNDSSLTSEERRMIDVWVENGCPQGDSRQQPPVPTFIEDWQLPRLPDTIIPMSDKPFVVPATAGPSGVPYQYLIVESGFQEDKWIRHAEVQPGNKTVVHHIIIYAVPPGKRQRADWIFLTAYVPGLRFDPLPSHSAKLVPAGSKFLFEQHYTPVGSKQTDVSRLGLIFADPEEITHEVITIAVDNNGFSIPPRDRNHVVTATSRPIRHDHLRLLSMSPHMHLRGKAFRYELVLPDGSRETLLDIPAYDFNWQTRYTLAEQRQLPPGSVLYCRAAFDNSVDNLANPDPSDTVTFGEQSWDEMMIGFCDVIVPRERKQHVSHRLIRSGYDAVGEFDRIDTDRNRLISRHEADQHVLLRKSFDEVDVNSDGSVSLEETLLATDKAEKRRKPE